jgi:hypothetical protein
LVWKKQALSVSPSAYFQIVNRSQELTVTGGSGSYTLSLVEGPSGGQAQTQGDEFSYLAGVVARKQDRLRVTDSLGDTADVVVNTVPDLPDHFVDESEAQEGGSVGQLLPSSVKVMLADRFGNGVSGEWISFESLLGGVLIQGSPLVQTDSEGYAQIAVKLGYFATKQVLRASRVGPLLPDEAGSGLTSVQVALSVAGGPGTGFGQVYSTGGVPSGIATADFDLDSRADFAIVGSDNRLRVFLGRGNGLFSPAAPVVTCAGPLALVVGNFFAPAGDSRPDPLVFCSASGSTRGRVFQGNSDGGFTPQEPARDVLLDSGVRSVVGGDFDRDGSLDFAAVSYESGKLQVFRGDGAGAFASYDEEVLGSSLTGVASGDFDGDLWPDLWVAGMGLDFAPSVWLVRGGPAGFAVAQQLSLPGTPSGVAVADLNGDGVADGLVAVESVGKVSLFVSSADEPSGFAARLDLLAGGQPSSVLAGDWDGEGSVSIAVANALDATVFVYRKNPSGGWGDPEVIDLVAEVPAALAAAETNGDGVIDLLVAAQSSQKVQVLTNNGAGASKLGWAAPAGASRGVAEDFDQDGKMDLAVVGESARILRVFRGQGGGVLAPVVDLELGLEPGRVVAADWNKDGKPDLAVVQKGSNSVRVFLGVGNGTFLPGSDYGTGSAPSALVPGDFDRDGNLDLVVANSTGNSVSFLAGYGNGLFSSKVDSPLSPGDGPVAIAAGDLNSDGVLDLVTANSGTSSIVSLLGLGNGSFSARPLIEVGSGPRDVVVADVNQDGVADVFVLSLDAATVSTFRGLGDGSFRPRQDSAVAAESSSFGVGDFNGNGTLDLVTANGSEGFYVGLGTGGGTFSSPAGYALASGGYAAGVIPGEWNGDGILDLVILNAQTASAELWLGR